MRAPKAAKNPRTTATLTAEQGRTLKALAERQKVSVSWLIRHAVDRLIDEESKGLQLSLDMPPRDTAMDTKA